MSQSCSQNITSQELYNDLLQCSFSSPLDWADKLSYSLPSLPDTSHVDGPNCISNNDDTAQAASISRQVPICDPPRPLTAAAYKDSIWLCILELSAQDPYSPSQNGPVIVRLCDLGMIAQPSDTHLYDDHITGVICEQRLYLQKCDFIKKIPEPLRNILGPIDRKFLRTECVDPGQTHNLCNVNIDEMMPLSHVSLASKRGAVYVNAIGALKTIHSQLIDILISRPRNHSSSEI